MTSQSKNARKLAKAREITRMHKQGEKGPGRTTPLHNKKWGYRDNPEVAKRISEAAKAASEDQKTNKTSAKRILQGAGRGRAAEAVEEAAV